MIARFASRLAVWLVLVGFAGLGAWAGGFILSEDVTTPAADPTPGLPPCPLPHHVPKYPGVASLRFAMVHDVLTERYPKHGSAYYEERNRLTKLALADEEKRMGDKPSRKYFELIDDLAVGLDHLGRHAESIALMRDKLKRQQALGQKDMDLYSTYANLGTFIILWEIHEGLADKKKARAGLEEGLDLIHKAIAINPRSHFGREIWQAVILEYLIAVLDDPELVIKFDMAGNRLDVNPFDLKWHGPFSHPLERGPWYHTCQHVREYLQKPAAEQVPDELTNFRSSVAKLEPGEDWNKAVKSSHTESVPFDEPTLGIIGMWRLGGGPNPFFAVALGEIMTRVGQKYIAWNAFERAYVLGDAVGPEPIAKKFKEHCRIRQQSIAEALPVDESKTLKSSFDIHLKKGLAYQKAYQEYEARRIKEGAKLNDPNFYAAFDAEHGVIASPVGDEDRLLPKDHPRRQQTAFSFGGMLLGAGIAAFVVALAVRAWDWTIRRKRAA